MSKRIHWIPAMGPHSIEETEVPPTLEAMQGYVEGNIELVNVPFKDEPTQMIVNDEGGIRKMPINVKATSLYHANSIKKGDIPDWFIHGPAILLEGIRLD